MGSKDKLQQPGNSMYDRVQDKATPLAEGSGGGAIEVDNDVCIKIFEWIFILMCLSLWRHDSLTVIMTRKFIWTMWDHLQAHNILHPIDPKTAPQLLLWLPRPSVSHMPMVGDTTRIDSKASISYQMMKPSRTGLIYTIIFSYWFWMGNYILLHLTIRRECWMWEQGQEYGRLSLQSKCLGAR